MNISIFYGHYITLSQNSLVILLDDFNGDLGDSIGATGNYKPNPRGLKLLELVNQFKPLSCEFNFKVYWPTCNVCVSLRLLYTRIFLANCLFDDIISTKTFEPLPENTSDQVLILI